MESTRRMRGEIAAEHERARRLMAEGLVGQATITEVRETGTTVNANPVVEFDLQVALDGRGPYAVTHRQVVSKLVVGTLAPGAVIPVRVDPGNVAGVMTAKGALEAHPSGGRRVAAFVVRGV